MRVRSVMVLTGSLLLICAVVLSVGCGRFSGTYHLPEGEGAGTLVLVNRIYPAGFNVWVDKKKAPFLDSDLAIPVEPGRHKIKLESKCTSLKAGMKKEEERAFEYEIEVQRGQTERLLLAWDHPGFRYKESDWHSSSKPKPVHPADTMASSAFAPGTIFPTQYPSATQWETTY